MLSKFNPILSYSSLNYLNNSNSQLNDKLNNSLDKNNIKINRKNINDFNISNNNGSKFNNISVNINNTNIFMINKSYSINNIRNDKEGSFQGQGSMIKSILKNSQNGKNDVNINLAKSKSLKKVSYEDEILPFCLKTKAISILSNINYENKVIILFVKILEFGFFS